MRRLVFVFLLALAAPAQARDWHVNNVVGDDINDGSSETTTAARSGPVQTIAAALRRAGHNDRVVLANTGEPYREGITVFGKNSGRPETLFTIVGNGAVLDGSRPVDDRAWEFFAGEVYRFQPRRKGTQQLFYEGRPLARGGAADASGRLPELEPLQWRYHQGFIYFRPESGRLPQHYALTHAAEPVGITLYQVMFVEIQDLTVQGFQLDGVNAHDCAFEVKLSGVNVRNNGRSGISIGGASQVMLQRSEVDGNGVAQLRTESWSRTKVVDSKLLDASAPAIVKEDHSSVSVDGAPR